MIDARELAGRFPAGASAAGLGRAAASLVRSIADIIVQRVRPRSGSFADAEGLAFLRLPGCPVCHSLERHDRRFFFWYFNESYSDVRSLERHMRALGFCPMHGTLVAQNSDIRYQEMPGSEQAAPLRALLRFSGSLRGDSGGPATANGRVSCRERLSA